MNNACKTILLVSLLTAVIFSLNLTASDFKVVYKDAQPATFKNICVFIDLPDLKLRSKFEQAMVQSISRYNHVSGYSGMQMFPPAKQWELSKIHDRLNNMNIEGIFRITYGSDTTNPLSTKNTFKATAIRNKDNLTVWIGTVEVPLESLTPEEIETFIKNYSSRLVTTLFDDGYIYDCKCGEGYKNLIKSPDSK